MHPLPKPDFCVLQDAQTEVTRSRRYSSEEMRSTHPFTFSHVVFNVSRLYRSSSSIVCSIFSLSFKKVPNIFFRLASEQISSRQGVGYAGEANLMHTRIDHVHHLWVHLFLHAPLLLFEFTRPVLL